MNPRMLNAFFAPIIPGMIFTTAFLQTELAGTVFFCLIGCLASAFVLHHLWKFPPTVSAEQENKRWKEPPDYE